MSLRLRPYPVYKESGVPWLGEVPEHWKFEPLRRTARIQLSNVDKHSVEGELPVRLCNYTDVYYRKYITARLRFMRATALPREVAKFELRKGDVLVTKDSELWTDIAVPAYVPDNLPDVLCGYHLAQIRPRAATIVGEYLFRAFQAEPVAYQFRIAAKGVTRFAIGREDLASALFPVPPLQEQEQIARFVAHLDWSTGRLIRAKQRLLALLNEQKQAIIQRAVTHGLDANVRLKPTESDWFPTIPAHWGVLPLRRLTSRIVDGPHHSPAYVDDGIPFISARNVKADRWSLSDAKFISQRDYDEFCKRVVPELDDVLYTKGGTTGVARVVDLDFAFQVWVHIAVIKVKKHLVVPRYLALVLNSPRCYEQSQLLTRGATNQDLGLGRMKDIVMPIPPTLDEQQAIVDEVQRKLKRSVSAVGRAEREIELLREYRTRLISDVVTGKLDVRGVALPELDASELGEELELEPGEEDEETGEGADEEHGDGLA